jgi:hypothetical protein
MLRLARQANPGTAIDCFPGESTPKVRRSIEMSLAADGRKKLLEKCLFLV